MSTSFEEARHIILSQVPVLSTESVRLHEAAGRVLTEDVHAPWPLPLWDNSAMDGYAVRVEDCQEPPARLQVTAYVPAGGNAEGITVEHGCAVKIMTGAPTPAGCTAVVPQEDTVEHGNVITVTGKVQIGDHIRRRGEDVASGALAVSAGTVLRSPQVSMLASLGRVHVPVYRQARVAVVSTGDELVEPGEPLGPGKIIDSNLVALAAALRNIGAIPVSLGIARDNHDSLHRTLMTGLQADVLITTAGVSAGDRDLVRAVLEDLGVKSVFWKVQIKPGRPTAFGLKDGRPVFSLPGNPVSSLLTFEQFVKPALLKMMGHRQVIHPCIKAMLAEPFVKKAGRVNFMRVNISKGPEGFVATNAGDQNTGILSTLLNANGVAILPAEQTVFAAGTLVDVQLFDSLQVSV